MGQRGVALRFGEQIREARLRRPRASRSRVAVAKLLGISTSYLYVLETGQVGRPSNRLLQSISDLYAIPIEELESNLPKRVGRYWIQRVSVLDGLEERELSSVEEAVARAVAVAAVRSMRGTSR